MERECNRATHRVTDLDVTSIDQEVAGRDGEDNGPGEEAPWYPNIKLTGRGGMALQRHLYEHAF